MKKIIHDLIAHIKEDFDHKTYGAVGLLLAMLIFFNYYFEFENVQAKLNPRQYLSLYLIGFPLVYYVALWLKAGVQPFKNRSFLLRSLFFILITATVTGFLFYRNWFAAYSPYEAAFLRTLVQNGMGVFLVFIPLFLFYWKQDRPHLHSFYGLTFQQHNFSPYIILLALMVPLIYFAALIPDFQASYPIFKPWEFEPVFGLSLTQMTALFESFYLLDFIRVELLFRGALIVGLARFLGKDAILPMVSLYCVLHFNKPMMETISSIFGGYLLGTIALYQRNIVGGCIIHIGIAGVMELLAYLL